jgi:hypothetical protein
MSTALSVQIESVAWWSPHLPSWETTRAVIRGEVQLPNETQRRPAPEVLAAAERRRAPDAVAVALEVALQATTAARRQPQELNSVFASTHGDLAISDYLCATLAATPALLSPTKFHHSVHNAAAGYWTIGTQTNRPYTALSAHHGTFAAGLLEAVLQVAGESRPVLYVAYDVQACGPMATVVASEHLFAVALVLTPSEDNVKSIELRLAMGAPSPPTEAHSVVAESVAGNALANAVPFFEALAEERSQVVNLCLSDVASLMSTLTFKA